MKKPYIDGSNGSLVFRGETDAEKVAELHKCIAYAHKRRWQVGIHAIGDAAVTAVVDGFAKAMKGDPWDARHYVIHGVYLSEQDAEKMAKYNIGASINVTNKYDWVYGDLDGKTVGPERDANSIPMKTLLDAGVRVANGSDVPETSAGWLQGIYAAITRKSKRTGQVRGPDQCVSVEQAIRSYTIDGAYLDHQDHIKGSIEVGKLADFCIIGDDITRIDPEKILEVPVLMTIIGGRVVYDAESK